MLFKKEGNFEKRAKEGEREKERVINYSKPNQSEHNQYIGHSHPHTE